MADGIQEYRGKSLIVRFDSEKCIHARHCVTGRPEVFVANSEGPWIRPDAASPEAIMEVSHACPSGAISYQRLDGGQDEQPPRVNLLRIRENGPVALHANATIEGRGPVLRATLCRCGASKNKPFCDSSHIEVGFQASGEPATGDTSPLENRDGPLAVRPLPNGPLLVEGNLEICAGTGRCVGRVTKTALCRCGGSANKPYCDGTHRTNGFVAE